MPKFGDITNVWSTIREINVSEIRESAEQSVAVAIIGEPELRAAVVRALYSGPQRFAGTERPVLREYALPLPRDRQSEVGQADFALAVIDTRGDVSVDVVATADKLSMLTIPCVVVLIGADQMPRVAGGGTLRLPGITTVFASDQQPDTIARVLLPVLVDKLPEDLRMAAARRIPGLRDGVGRWLISDVAFSNATYSLTSGLPEMVPLLNIPLNAADILVLTKNQALLVYKIALAYGAPPDFQSQMKEVLPVIGGGFLWRQVARQLIGLIPGFGILPKVAVAYAGTYATGQAAAMWYRSGEILSGDALTRLYRQAMTIGRERAKEILQRRKQDQPPATSETKRLPGPPKGLRRFWPFGRNNT